MVACRGCSSRAGIWVYDTLCVLRVRRVRPRAPIAARPMVAAPGRGMPGIGWKTPAGPGMGEELTTTWTQPPGCRCGRHGSFLRILGQFDPLLPHRRVSRTASGVGVQRARPKQL